MKKLSIEEQVALAVDSLKELFVEYNKKEPPPPGATVESLWAELQKRNNKSPKPKVVAAVKLLIENQALASLSIPVIARLIREVFAHYGIDRKCSESSIRWYLSNHALDWDIIRRKNGSPKVKIQGSEDS